MVKGDWNISKITNNIIENRLYDNGNFDKGALASLRGSNSLLSKKATAVMLIMLSELPKNSLSVDGTPTYAENAVFTALRCYAIYQQGNDHYVNGSSSKSIFEALELIKNGEIVVTKNNNVTTFFALKGKKIHCQSQNLSFNLSFKEGGRNDAGYW